MDIITYLSDISAASNSSFLISDFIGNNFKYDLFPQLNIEGSFNKTSKDLLKNQTSLQVKWLNEHIVKRAIEPWKNTNAWVLACLVYNNIPIALLRNSGLQEDYFSKLIVIDKNNYYYAASYLFNFIKEDFGPNLEPYDVIGSLSGDINTHINKVNIKSYNLNNTEHVTYINKVLNYTIDLI